MKYQNILFDADGTLFDFKRAEHDALSDTLLHFNIPDTEEVHRGYSESNAAQWALLEKKLVTREALKINRFQNFLDKFGFSGNAVEMACFYENALSTKSYLIEGAEEICRSLAARCNLYIVTNGFKHIQSGRFGASPILPLLKGVFISEEIGVEKPDPVFFDYVASHISGFKKETALIVGDSLSSDILGGVQSGIDTCWFNPEGKTTPTTMPITYTISSLSQLEHII